MSEYLAGKVQSDMVNVKTAKAELLVALEELEESFNNWCTAMKRE